MHKPFISEGCILIILQNDPIKLGKGQFGCPFCNREAMKKQRDMKRHIMIHTGEKPFSCDYCSYAAAEMSNLKRHITKHHLYK